MTGWFLYTGGVGDPDGNPSSFSRRFSRPLSCSSIRHLPLDCLKEEVVTILH